MSYKRGDIVEIGGRPGIVLTFVYEPEEDAGEVTYIGRTIYTVLVGATKKRLVEFDGEPNRLKLFHPYFRTVKVNNELKVKTKDGKALLFNPCPDCNGTGLGKHPTRCSTCEGTGERQPT